VRVLFTTRASGGHLWPMMPLARSFVIAGHRVRVAVPPECVDAVVRAGLLPVAVGGLPASGAGRPAGHVVRPADAVPAPTRGAAHPGAHARPRAREDWPADWPVRPDTLTGAQRRLLRALAGQRIRTAEAMAPDLVHLVRSWLPDLVVHDASTYAGTVAAGVLGVPAVSHLWGSTAVLRTDRENLDPAGEPPPAYARLLERYGVDPAKEPDLWLDPCPPSLALPSPVHRMDVRYEPSADNPAGWVASRAAAAGQDDTLSGTGDPARTGDTMITGDAGSGAHAVVRAPTAPRICLAWDGSAGPPPAVLDALREVQARGIRVVRAGGPTGPLSAVLPGCRALVHQGGGAVLVAAAVTGVPQLIVPPGPEQQLNAARLAGVGAGRHGARMSGRHLAQDLFALLEQPRHVRSARALRGEALAMQSADEVMTRLTGSSSPGTDRRPGCG
jgi:hypothetical protein